MSWFSRFKKRVVLVGIAVFAIPASWTSAEVILDGTMGVQGALNGPDYQITSEQGKQSGSNLFHSFSQFNLTKSESATFSGPESVDNIIARITGGSPSSIDGLLQSTIPGANLYLLNSAGILFGANATLAVQGSFHVSTADYLRLGDNERFYTIPVVNEVFSSAPPSAFGFLDNTPASITIQGAQLSVPEGQAFSIIGGDLSVLQDTNLQQPAKINATGGRVNLASVASAGEVVPADNDLDTSSFASMGAIQISSDLTTGTSKFSDILSKGSQGGDIYIRGGQFVLDQGQVATSGTGDSGGGGRLDIKLTGDLSVKNSGIVANYSKGANGIKTEIDVNNLIILDGGQLVSGTSGAGNGSDVNIVVKDSISITNAPGIATLASSSGNAGNLSISAQSITMNKGDIASFTEKSGQSGVITVKASSLSLTNNALLYNAQAGGTGLISNLSIQTETLELSKGAFISTSTSQGQQTGGDLNISASKSVSLTGVSETKAGLTSGLSVLTETSGNSGNLTLITPKLTISNGAKIVGEVVEGSSGHGGIVNIQVETLEVKNGGGIATNTLSSGDSGKLEVLATGFISISGSNSQLASDSASQGNAGTLSITTPSLSVIDGGQILAKATASGNGGYIEINTETLSLIGGKGLNFSQITASSTLNSTGNGGSILINASKAFTIDGQGGVFHSGVSANNVSSKSGTLAISTPKLSLIQNAEISSTTMFGQGGLIDLDVGELSIVEGMINTSGQSGRGGEISIQATKSITLGGEDNLSTNLQAIIENFAYNTGYAGNVKIESPILTIQNGSAIRSSLYQEGLEQVTFESPGAGGNVDLNVGKLELKNGGFITTETTAAGNGGNISIEASESILVAGFGTKFGYGPLKNSGLFNTSSSLGNAGSIVLKAPSLTLGEGGKLASSVEKTGESGIGGNIELTLDTLSMSGKSLITVDTKGTGQAGNVSILTKNFSLESGSQVSSKTQGSGNAGKISIAAQGNVSISGQTTTQSSGLFSTTSGTGNAGEVLLTAPALTMSQGGQIAVSAEGTGGNNGAGGNIQIQVDSLSLKNVALITAATQGAGNAGNITLNVQTATLESGGQITTATQGAGKGGVLSVTATKEIAITGLEQNKNSGIYSTTKDIGQAGTISIHSSLLTVGQDGQIAASSEGLNEGSGSGGNLQIQADTLVLKNGGVITVDTKGTGHAGSISLEVQNATLESGGQVSSGTQGMGNAGSLSVNAKENITISGVGQEKSSGLFSTTTSTGKAGDITIHSAQLTLDQEGIIAASVDTTQQSGEGGSIQITTTGLTASNKGVIKADTKGDGNAGSLNVNTGILTLESGGQLSTETQGKGKAGTLTVVATGELTIKGVSEGQNSGLFSTTSSSGDAGNVIVQTPKLLLDEGGVIAASVETKKQSGQGGDIQLQADTLIIQNTGLLKADTQGTGSAGIISVNSINTTLDSGGRISTETQGAGNAGTLSITASESIHISGQSGDIYSGLFSTTKANGNAGTVTVKSPSLTLEAGGTIAASAEGLDLLGEGGNIQLEVDLLSLKDHGWITAGTKGYGAAGSIAVTGKQIDVESAGKISTETEGAGNAGNITLNASESITIHGNKGGANSSLLSTTAYLGNAGDITLTTPELLVSQQGQISTSSQSTGKGGLIQLNVSELQIQDYGKISSESLAAKNGGDAGNIEIHSDIKVLMNKGAITTESKSGGGGSIVLQTKELLHLESSSITTTVQGGTGDAGNIEIDPELVLLDKSLIVANAFGGKGGNIHIKADHFIQSADSFVQASSQLGIDGSINIDSPIIDIGAILEVLPSSFLDASQLIQKRCGERSGEIMSRFVVLGKGGIPTSPDDLQPGLWPDVPHQLTTFSPFEHFPGMEQITQDSDPLFSLSLEAPCI
ncbi:filamentous hemagglutinin N-terminal domain-containing protein [Deltaproteobacteria bacterium TL4]